MTSEIIQGNVLDVLSRMGSGSVNCCITSPPYWGLRDYGVSKQIWCGDPSHEHLWGDPITVNATNHTDKRRWNHTRNGRGEEQPLDKQVAWLRTNVDQGSFCECGAWRGSLGLEPTPELFTDHIVEVFREVRRVLRDDGTLWLNLGDSYATGAGKVGDCPGGGAQGDAWKGHRGSRGGSDKQPHTGSAIGPLTQPNRLPIPGLKPKDLVGIPWRVAFALQADGWWLRSDIIWAKPAPMPESVTDRPTRSHEYIFLLAKSEKYFCDMEAVKESAICGHPSGNGYKRNARLSYQDERGARGSDEQWKPRPAGGWHQGSRGSQEGATAPRDKRVRPSAVKGSFNGKTEAMADTGQNAFRAVTEMRNLRDVWTVDTQPFPEAHFATFPPRLIEPCVIAGCPIGGAILDPFAGAGTTGLVAKKHGRNFIGIELNPAYVAMAEKRLAQEVLPFSQIPQVDNGE